MSWASRVVALAAVAGGLGVAACDVSAECLPWFRGVNCVVTDLGHACTNDDKTLKRVTVKPGSNDVVSDPGFEFCENFYCSSTNGSRPYCTRRCESAFDCSPGGIPCLPNMPAGIPCWKREDWTCEVVIEFGALACATVDPDTGTCEIDEETGKVKNPVKYCRARDGYIELGTVNEPGATPTPDAGR